MLDHVTYAPGGELGDLVALVGLGNCKAYVRSSELDEHEAARHFVNKILPRAQELAEGKTDEEINNLTQEQADKLMELEGTVVVETMSILVEGRDPIEELPPRVARAAQDIQHGRRLRPWKSPVETEDFNVQWAFNETMLQVLNYNPAKGKFEIAPHFATEEHLFSVYPETLLHKRGLPDTIARRQASLAEFDREKVYNSTRKRVKLLIKALKKLRGHRNALTPSDFARTAVLGRVMVKPIFEKTRVSASRIDAYFGLDGDPEERQRRMARATLPADCLITDNGEEVAGVEVGNFGPVTVPLGATSIPVDHFTLPRGYSWEGVNRWVLTAPALES